MRQVHQAMSTTRTVEVCAPHTSESLSRLRAANAGQAARSATTTRRTLFPFCSRPKLDISIICMSSEYLQY